MILGLGGGFVVGFAVGMGAFIGWLIYDAQRNGELIFG